jgi:hypothetical protein
MKSDVWPVETRLPQGNINQHKNPSMFSKACFLLINILSSGIFRKLRPFFFYNFSSVVFCGGKDKGVFLSQKFNGNKCPDFRLSWTQAGRRRPALK